ncbi:hypothetical protein TOPH_02480, partial [Tolypocladium ophioglossoides CBS 100239]
MTYSEANMSSPCHKFFPLGDIGKRRDEAVSEVLISPIRRSRPALQSVASIGATADDAPRRNTPNFLHAYGLPEACKAYSDISQGKLEGHLEQWFKDIRLKVKSPASPICRGAVQLDA